MKNLAVIVVVFILVSSGSQAWAGRVGGFEGGNFGEFDYWATSNGSLTVTNERAYEGARSAKASNNAVGNQYQRTWYDVSWGAGSDVWYGMALYIPRLSDWCWWEPVRWDNYKSFGSSGDVGGVRIENGQLYVDQGTYSSQHALIGPVAVPERRWFWLEVHQRLSGSAGSALSELFVDGAKVGSSTAANSKGRRIDNIRFGNVAMAPSCSQASSIYFDRASITTSRLGPGRTQQRPADNYLINCTSRVGTRERRNRRPRRQNICRKRRVTAAVNRPSGGSRTQVSVERRHTRYAAGTVVLNRHRRKTFLVTPRRPLRAGRYVVRLTTKNRVRRLTIIVRRGRG